MADAAVAFLLGNLKQLLVYNADLIIDIKSQVESLYNDLCLFKAFLKDAFEKRSKYEYLKELVKQIRSVVYEAEDTIDLFVSQATAHKARNSIGRAVHSVDYMGKLRDVGLLIEQIRVKVKHIYDYRQYGFEALAYGDGLDGINKEKKPPVVEEENVIGFKDEAEKVINLLMGDSDELEVISIIGMPGLGKTTLARMIYRDPKIEYEFQGRAWVYVSQEYSRKEIFLNILSNLVQLTDAVHQMTDESLGRELCKELQIRKYLIVMDDVWTEQAWNDLKVAFPKNGMGSRILLTSRVRAVAKHANPNREPHSLRFLTPEESWRLLQIKALGAEDCPPELQQVGRRIANKCDNLPLAIVVIGGILLEKGTDWWERVAESVDTYLSMDREKRMNKIIALSFNHIPYHLKACFLYFGMFPEDFEIPVRKLIRLWIAEGFIQQKQELSLEDIGEEYLDNLVNMNLVMVGKRRTNGKIKTCRIHDMLHDFCKEEAAGEDFFHEIKCSDSNQNINHPAMGKHRRLCIHSRVLDYLRSKPVSPNVRSFLCFSSEETYLVSEHVSTIPAAFKLLRVLDSKTIRFSRFPGDIVQLVHLRYIVLSGEFKILPAQISCLWNIQTIVVETSARPLEIKADIWRMIQLRHVKTNASTILPRPASKSRKSKDEILMIASLQTLSTISPESCTDDVFARTPNLKTLGIRGQLFKLLESRNGSNTSFDCLGKLSSLENLKLLNDMFPRPASEGRISMLPQSYKFPPKLKKLTLTDTSLEWRHMSTIGMLENLQILKLKNYAFKGDSWQSEDGGFRALRYLLIERTDLVSWFASSHHFRELRHLVIKHCNKLQAIPREFADISSLQVVDLYRCPIAAPSARIIEKARKDLQGNQTRVVSPFKLAIYPPDNVQA